MKRTRRITVEVEQRKVTFSFTRMVVPEVRAAEREAENTDGQAQAPVPPVCPVCGSAWIAVGGNTGEDAAVNKTAIYQALQRIGAHAHLSVTGEIRICSKSFESFRFDEVRTDEIRTDEIKESL
jgi:NAD-dependent DNA ligase